MSFAKTTGLDPVNLTDYETDYIYYWQLWHHNWDDADIECVLSQCELPGKRVLEVGCGDGRVAFALASHCRELTAVDQDARFVEIAKARMSTDRIGANNLSFEQMDAQKLEFPDESFDLVLYPWVLQMVPDKALAMKEACRVLKPGGKLFLIGLRSDADYDTIISKFIESISAIDTKTTYEVPIRSCFDGRLEQTTKVFKYFFHSKKLALQAFSFALTYWYATTPTEKMIGELEQLLENYKDGERICINFPAEIYQAAKS